MQDLKTSPNTKSGASGPDRIHRVSIGKHGSAVKPGFTPVRYIQQATANNDIRASASIVCETG